MMTIPPSTWRGSAIAIVSILLILIASRFDARLAARAAQVAPAVKAWAKFFSLFGLSNYMLILSALIGFAASAAVRQGRDQILGLPAGLLVERAAYFFVTIALSGILAQIIKHCVGRARPKLMPELGAFHFDIFSLRGSLASFPSGHTTTVFAAAFCLSVIEPRGRILFYAAALLIALARILAGDHYPSDVAAGAGLGTLVALWMAWAFGTRNIAFQRIGPSLVLKRRIAKDEGGFRVSSAAS